MAFGGYALLDSVTGAVPSNQGGTGDAVSYTSGAVLFGDTDGTIATNSSKFFWDNTNERIGIGTGAPTAAFHLIQKAATSGSPVGIDFTPGTHTTLTAATYIDIALRLNSTAQFTAGAAFVGNGVNIAGQKTLSATAAQTIDAWATVNIIGGALAGTNVTLSESVALNVDTFASNSDIADGANFSVPGIANGFGAATERAALRIAGDTFSLGNQTATLTDLAGISIGQSTFTSTTLVRTVTNPSSLYIEGAPVASTNVTFTNGPFAIWVDSGNVRLDSLVTFSPSASTSGSPNLLSITGPSHTTLAASTEASDISINLNRTVEFSAGALTNQRAIFIQKPDYAFTGASTITNAQTLNVNGAPGASTNATITAPVCAQFGGSTGTYPATTTFEFSTIRVPQQTITLSGTTGITSNQGAAVMRLYRLTLTNASANTMNAAATLWIENDVAVAGSQTITDTYALWVDSGISRFDGSGTYVFELPADATDPTGGGGAAAGRIPVKIGGATRYLAYY